MSTGITPPAMSAEQAAWVRAHAWQSHHRATYAQTPAVLTSCWCQYGPCGHCGTGRHDLCAQVVVSGPVTWITGPNGTANPATAAVYEVGHAHVWRCPCTPHHPRRWVEPTLWD